MKESADQKSINCNHSPPGLPKSVRKKSGPDIAYLARLVSNRDREVIGFLDEPLDD